MDFIYRLPLLAFDIEDPLQIAENFESVLTAIMLSSPPFYQRLKGRSYFELNAHEQLKLYKYLLRGRYRQTPFGTWAGIGTGNWGNEFSYVDQEPEFLSYPNKLPRLERYLHLRTFPEDYPEEIFTLNPSTNSNNFYYIFWDYNLISQQWEEVSIKSNKVLDRIHHHFSTADTIEYSTFCSWFMDVDKAILIPVWKAAIHSGWLIPATFPSICEDLSVKGSRKNKVNFFSFSGSCKIDAHFTTAIIQKKSILQNLKQIPQEMGNLFKANHHTFLAGFARCFHEEYDDRYIPLHQLFNPHSKCMDYLKTQLRNSKGDTTSTNSFHPVRDIILSMIQDEFIDLSKVIKHRELENQSELSMLYRLGEDHQIILNHAFTCGPLSLIGRFTADPNIYEYGKSRIQQVFTEKDIIYADFELLENDSSHRVSTHQNLLPFKIIYHQKPSSSNEIPLSAIWIGIDEDKIILYHPTLQKRILPVLQHCLNKNFITHPICRLIYEIACQDQLQLALHLSELPPFVNRVPRITWKNIIISPAIWILHLPASIEMLSKELKEKAVPRYLLAGEGDQELLIDTHGKGLNILFNLLEKQSKIKVSECNWIHNPVYSSQNGAPIFPQFLVNLSILKSTSSPTPSFRFNPRKAPDRTWIGVRVYLSKLDVKNFLVDNLQPFLSGLPKAQQPVRWFYLAYVDSKFHLRIRFKINEKTKAEFEKELHYFLALVPEISHHRAELYYPEYAKYSHESIQLSEMLFHLESNMMVSGYKEMNLHCLPFLRMEELEKMNFAIHFGYHLFYTFKISRMWYEAYKVIVTSYSGEERGKFKAFSEGNFLQTADTESLNVFKKQYLQVLEEHAFILDDQLKIKLLQNHFHMMINRLFPDASVEVEPYIMYCIFRKTAKLIYAPKQWISPK